MSGATKEDEQTFKALLERDTECKKCFECGYPYPQWCSYTHGIFTCLECSGKHRGLGTHLVCVRSSTMDGWSNWKPEKLRQMEVGGNRRAREFFEARGIPKTPLKSRYEHPAAQLYRAMLEAEGNGTPFNEKEFRSVDYAALAAKQMQGSPATPGSRGTPASAGAGGNTNANSRFQGIGSPGSRQAGAPAEESEWLSALSSGWNTVTTKATSAASVAAKSVENTAHTVTSQDFKEKVSHGASEAGATVSEGATKAWGAVAFFATSLASTVKKQVGGEEEEDGLGGLTRNVPHERSPQYTSEEHLSPKTEGAGDGLAGLTRNVPHTRGQYGHEEHLSPSSPEGLRGLTSNLPHANASKYEGFGSDAPARPTGAPTAKVATTATVISSPTPASAPPQAKEAPSASKDEGWDEDW